MLLQPLFFSLPFCSQTPSWLTIKCYKASRLIITCFGNVIVFVCLYIKNIFTCPWSHWYTKQLLFFLTYQQIIYTSTYLTNRPPVYTSLTLRSLNCILCVTNSCDNTTDVVITVADVVSFVLAVLIAIICAQIYHKKNILYATRLWAYVKYVQWA